MGRKRMEGEKEGREKERSKGGREERRGEGGRREGRRACGIVYVPSNARGDWKNECLSHGDHLPEREGGQRREDPSSPVNTHVGVGGTERGRHKERWMVGGEMVGRGDGERK